METLKIDRGLSPENNLRKSLDQRLKNKAKELKLPVENVRKRFVFQVFLSRLFSSSFRDSWVLLGGVALVARHQGGRTTKDIDLAYQERLDDVQGIYEKLKTAVNENSLGDDFNFQLGDPRIHESFDGYMATTCKISVVASIGAKKFDDFWLDIVQARHTGEPDLVRHDPILDYPAETSHPPFPVVPIEDHLADKICAVYERHRNNTPSTRYRDLADIAQIVSKSEINAEYLCQSLDRESRRRRLELPKNVEIPDESWRKAYGRAASSWAGYPSEFSNLETALRIAGTCLNPILSRSRPTGTWDPTQSVWQ